MYFNILPTEQPNIQEEPHGTSQPPAKRLTPIADRMRARETLAERDIFEGNLEMQMVRKGKIEERGGEEEAVILLRYS